MQRPANVRHLRQPADRLQEQWRNLAARLLVASSLDLPTFWFGHLLVEHCWHCVTAAHWRCICLGMQAMRPAVVIRSILGAGCLV
jgi:hypothetical protein